MADQYILPLERKCFCGEREDPDPAASDHVRTVNGWTIAFCHERCAERFDAEIAHRQPQPALQLVSSERR